MKEIVSLIRMALWFTLFAAIYQELRKPAAERTWHGKVAGVVPYDFRIPTMQRLRKTYWSPDTDRVFSEHVFGVGWGVNIPVAARKISETATQYAAASRKVRTP